METHPVEQHRQRALRHVAQAERLSNALSSQRVGSDAWRGINGRLGVALKLASVHAHLAEACALAPAFVEPAPQLEREAGAA